MYTSLAIPFQSIGCVFLRLFSCLENDVLGTLLENGHTFKMQEIGKGKQTKQNKRIARAAHISNGFYAKTIFFVTSAKTLSVSQFGFYHISKAEP